MFSGRYQPIIHRVAIFLVLFASLAPSISHALAVQNKNNNFLQEVCSSDGTKKIVLQILTTQGHQLSRIFDTKKAAEDSPASNALHLGHCPFCGSAIANIAIMPPSSKLAFILTEQINEIAFNELTPLQSNHLQTAHPARAPPAI